MRSLIGRWTGKARQIGFGIATLVALCGAPSVEIASAQVVREAQGAVQAVDAKAGRLVIKVRSGKELTFTVPPARRQELANVKAGDRVDVHYASKDGVLVFESFGHH